MKMLKNSKNLRTKKEDFGSYGIIGFEIRKLDRRVRAKIRKSMGLKSPCLKYREIAKEMVEAAREGQKETYQAKRPTTNA